jgi:glucose dehydrogenase
MSVREDGRNGVDRLKTLIGTALVAVLGAGAVVIQSQERATREWRYYGADQAFTRYSPLDQVHRNNVTHLKIAWRRPAVNATLTDAFPDLKINPYLKSTPIVVDGAPSCRSRRQRR